MEIEGIRLPKSPSLRLDATPRAHDLGRHAPVRPLGVCVNILRDDAERPGATACATRSSSDNIPAAMKEPVLELRFAMKASGDPDRKRAVRHLRQLIDALNDRVPHIERVGEVKIARDAADLMGKALKRLKELEESD